MEPSDVRRAYAVLGLSPPVPEATVKRQYRRLVKRWHPDRYSSDPAGREEAAQRMRELNEAYRLISSTFRMAGEAGLVDPPPVASAAMTSGLPRQSVEEIIAAINRERGWIRPRMSRSRWLSLSVALAYSVLPQVILPAQVVARPEISRAVGKALGYLLLPLCLIWMAEADTTPIEGERIFKAIGWTLMALPAFAGVVWILWRFSG